MTKKEVSQYYYLGREILRCEELIRELTFKLSRAKGPRTLELANQIEELKLQKENCSQLREEISRYVKSIDDSLTRQILTEKHLRGKTWVAVSYLVGGGNTPDSVRKISERFFQRLAN